MKTWQDIAKALNEGIPPSLIEPANQQAGIYGNWMRGHTVMQLANKVFGPDGWTSYIISPPKMEERVVAINNAGVERLGVLVTCIVQITGRGLDENGKVVEVTKQDIGWGTAAQSWQGNQYQPLKPQQMRPALMGAITIGFKRCFHQFGRHLGMELYMPDEDVIALGWEEGEAPAETATTQRRPPAQQAQQPAQRPSPVMPNEPTPTEPAPRQRASAGDASPVSTTVSLLAKELGIEVTKKNQRALADLGIKDLAMKLAGRTMIRTKKVQATFESDQGSTVAEVHKEMASYAVWMASQVDEKPQSSKPFQDMAKYDLLQRQTGDLRYMLQGGTYEPWPKADIHDPTVMIGYAIEQIALKSLVGGLMGRFPEVDEAAADEYNSYHLRKHLEKHFLVERLGLLTWEQLAAFRLHVTEGQAYPEQWSGGEGEQGPEELPVEHTDEQTDKDAYVVGAPTSPAEPEPALPENYADQCEALLIEIQEQITTKVKVTDEKGKTKTVETAYAGDLATFAAKQGDLSLANAHNVVKGIHTAVEKGNLRDSNAVETLLTTALKGLT